MANNNYVIVDILNPLVIFDKTYCLMKYFNFETKVLDFNVEDDFKIDENTIKRLKIQIYIDFFNDFSKFYICEIVDNEELFFDFAFHFNIPDYFKMLNSVYYNSFIYRSFNNVKDRFTSLEDLFDDLDDFVHHYDSYLSSVIDRFSEVEDKINGATDIVQDVVNTYYNELRDKISDVNVDLTPVINKLNVIEDDVKHIDFTPVINDLDEIKSLFNQLQVLEIAKLPEKIKETAKQLVGSVSLNGNFGAKFKDGENVIIKGYEGQWVVDGSFFVITSDNTYTIIYKVSQGDKTLLAPASFVSSAE